MVKNELKKMTTKQLEKLLEDVKKALATARARDRSMARKAAEKAAAEFGFSLGDLGGTEKKAKKAPRAKAVKKVGTPKYRNPKDATQTWTGKGRKPNWFVQEVESGTSEEALTI